MNALLAGRTLIGERCWDVSRAIDLALTYDEIDPDRIICTGQSGGGTATYYAACMDDRIAVAMPCCGICTFKDSIGKVPHCVCNFVPNIAKYMDMGDMVVSQLFEIPKVMWAVGAAMIFLGVTTELPLLIFVPMGAGCIVIGNKMQQKAGIEKIEEETGGVEAEAEEIRRPENVVSLLQVDPIELEFGYGIIPLADVNQGGDLLDRVVMIRRQIALELGVVVPIIRLRDNIQLNPNQYIIKIKGVQISEGEILFDHYMAMNPGMAEEEITGIPTFEPSYHLPALWITESQREREQNLLDIQ
jgi:flagellar biosynthesis protein FlhA